MIITINTFECKSKLRIFLITQAQKIVKTSNVDTNAVESL